MEILVVLIVGLLIAAPIIAIVAYVRVQELTAKLNSTGVQDSVRRLNALEQRLSSLERKLTPLATPVQRILLQRSRLRLPPYRHLSLLVSYPLLRHLR